MLNFILQIQHDQNMIKRTEIQKIVNNYTDLRIAVLGSHSALEIMDGA